MEDTVDAAIRSLFGRINLPLPSFNMDFTRPVRRACERIARAATRVLEQATAIKVALQSAFTDLLPEGLDLSGDFNIDSFIPEVASDLPCISAECALQMPAVAGSAAEIEEFRDFIQGSLLSIDRSFLHAQYIEYLQSFSGCNGTTTIRAQVAQFLPESIEVEGCNLNEPQMEFCQEPLFRRPDILENLTATVRTMLEFTPSQRRMIRRVLTSCTPDYLFRGSCAGSHRS